VPGGHKGLYRVSIRIHFRLTWRNHSDVGAQNRDAWCNLPHFADQRHKGSDFVAGKNPGQMFPDSFTPILLAAVVAYDVRVLAEIAVIAAVSPAFHPSISLRYKARTSFSSNPIVFFLPQRERVGRVGCSADCYGAHCLVTTPWKSAVPTLVGEEFTKHAARMVQKLLRHLKVFGGLVLNLVHHDVFRSGPRRLARSWAAIVGAHSYRAAFAGSSCAATCLCVVAGTRLVNVIAVPA